jgi:hypothetical protein
VGRRVIKEFIKPVDAWTGVTPRDYYCVGTSCCRLPTSIVRTYVHVYFQCSSTVRLYLMQWCEGVGVVCPAVAPSLKWLPCTLPKHRCFSVHM